MFDNSNSIPGGYYIGVDGFAHDANGKRIPFLEEQKLEVPVVVAAEPIPAPAPTPSPVGASEYAKPKAPARKGK